MTEFSPQELQRLQELSSYAILDTLPEEDFDNLTAIAAEICNTPISLVTLLDESRQWFKSGIGLDVKQTPRKVAFCDHAIRKPDELFVVADAREDSRFSDNPLVTEDPNIVFYAGIPLKTPRGFALGALCVIDRVPRELTASQMQSLRALGQQVMNLLELRRNKFRLEQTLERLEQKNQALEKFATLAAHDLKSPLMSISGISDLFLQQYGTKLNDDEKELIGMMKTSTDQLRNMVDGLLNFSRSEMLVKEDKNPVVLPDLQEEMMNYFKGKKELELRLSTDLNVIETNDVALKQILINLISNAVKYNDKERCEVNLQIRENGSNYHFSVSDNGPGIHPSKHEKIFNLFETVASRDRFGEQGSGIGLATVKKLVEALEGKIEVVSDIGTGADFRFSIKK